MAYLTGVAKDAPHPCNTNYSPVSYGSNPGFKCRLLQGGWQGLDDDELAMVMAHELSHHILQVWAMAHEPLP